MAKRAQSKPDAIITSPPFSSSKVFGDYGFLKKNAGLIENDGDMVSRLSQRIAHEAQQTKHPDNLDRLGYGNPEAIIFSPSYASEVFAAKAQDRRAYFAIGKGKVPGHAQNLRGSQYASPGNVGNLDRKYGIGNNSSICRCRIAGVLRFTESSGFGPFASFFTKESRVHPAKANLFLLHYLIRTYTKPGELVLDPMAGTGSTLIMASILGRRGLGVELEPGFVNLIRANIEKAKATGKARREMGIVQGDARNLPGLLSFPGDNAEAVVFSPPFGPANRGGGIAKGKMITVHGFELEHGSKRLEGKLSANPENLSNLEYGNRKGPTYLSEMLRVYAGAFATLKPGGKMVVMVRDFIRNKKLVLLHEDTIRLCRAVGFELEAVYLFKLPVISFWRVLYYRKHPEAPRIEHEHVLIFQKRPGNQPQGD